MIRWVIGAGETQRFCADVMAHSIRENSSEEVEILHTYDVDRPTYKGYPNPPHYPPDRDTTPFAYVRVWVPEWLGYEGKAIVTDCDMLVLGDAKELWEWPMKDYWVMKSRCTGVLLMDLEACRHMNVLEAFEHMAKKRWAYGDVVAGLCKTPREKLGEIDHRWNAPERRKPDTCLLHYTARSRQPWDFPGQHPEEALWIEWAVKAVEAGAANARDAEELAIWPTLEKALRPAQEANS